MADFAFSCALGSQLLSHGLAGTGGPGELVITGRLGVPFCRLAAGAAVGRAGNEAEQFAQRGRECGEKAEPVHTMTRVAVSRP